MEYLAGEDLGFKQHEKSVRGMDMPPPEPHQTEAEFKPMLFMSLLWTSMNSTALICTVVAATLALLLSSLHRNGNGVELPEGVCFWQQGSVIHNIPAGPSTPDCKFEVRDAEFLEVLGSSPKLELAASTEAHEGGVYFPDRDEFYFTSSRVRRGVFFSEQNTEVKKLSLKTGEVSTVFPVTDVASGMVLDHEGKLVICHQGQGEKPGSIQRVDLKTLNSSVIADSWFGMPFNSPNDVVVKSDGSIWFTDPNYGWVRGFRAKLRVQNQVYRISPSGKVDVVATSFSQPNGLAFSEDEKCLFVTDTGFKTGAGEKYDETKPHHIYAFDVLPDGKLGSRRLFASIGLYDGKLPGLGVPRGIKVDMTGRVYTGSGDGVQVFSRTGKPLGLIRLSGVVNMGFAGKRLNKLYMLKDSAIHFIELQATGAGLHYAASYRYSQFPLKVGPGEPKKSY